MLLPWGPWNGYEKFRSDMDKYFPKRLPDFLGPKWTPFLGRKWTPARTIYGILYFSSDWTPHVVRCERPHFLASPGLGFQNPKLPRFWLTDVIKIALQPVMVQLGLDWQRPVTPSQASTWLDKFLGIFLTIPLIYLALIIVLPILFWAWSWLTRAWSWLTR
jgi:hypothetical protein